MSSRRRTRRPGLALGVAGAATVAAVVALAAPATIAAAPAAAVTGQVRNSASGLCLDDTARSQVDETQVEVWACNGNANQSWTLTDAKELRVYSTKCLDVYAKGRTDGTKVVIYTCNGGANEKWTFNSNGSLTDQNSGKCLDAKGTQVNGTLLTISTCTGASNQSWSRPGSGTTPPVTTPPVTTPPVTTPPVTTPPTSTNLPCDIYAAGKTPCVAAHSTVRALYRSYQGRLYQVQRAKDDATLDIGVLTAGGYANAAAQDTFCASTSCLITVIYDQSGKGNNLTRSLGGRWVGPGPNGVDDLADATLAPTTVGGHKAYGVYVTPGVGYRNNKTTGIATGDQPEGMYAIVDGTRYNTKCCFDYGNAETNGRDNGNGTMEAIYFGNSKQWGYGAGQGPWVMSDMENGMFSGVNKGYNANDPTVSHRYVTAVVKGEPNHWAIRAGDAQSGGLSTFYNGVRPNVTGYDPMKKEGAIILGTGGDNSISALGTFYEGAMTSGYPSDATENAVQADITSVGYR